MRSRTEGFNLNTYYKYNIIKDNNFTKKNLNELISKETTSNTKPMKETYENLENYLQNTLVDSFPSHSNNSINNYKINIECPKISNNNKSFKTLTKDNKPIKFSEKAYVPELDNNVIGTLEEKIVNIDFNKFLAMFDNEEELDDITIENLLNIDNNENNENLQKLNVIYNNIKEKCENDEFKEEALKYIDDLKEEYKTNEDNIENLMCNIDKAKDIVFDNENIKINFDINK